MNAMNLVYQTADRDRADHIVGVLAEAGIETSLHGIHTSELRIRQFGNPLTVWVMKDSEKQKANEILEAFFASEAPTRSPAALGPPSTAKKWMPFLVALAIGAALAAVAHGI